MCIVFERKVPEMSCNVIETSFISNGTEIFYTKWIPDDVKGILQIAHGMAEYINRYDRFARFMADNGYAVYGDDHRGHGRTGRAVGTLGKLAEKNGYNVVTDDIKALTDIAKADYPDVPVILLGHSMGSFLVRNYAASYSDNIDKLIIMGTGGPNPASGAGIFIVNLIAAFKGEDYLSPFVNNLAFGSYNKRTEGRTAFDWLSVNTENVDRYIADEMCGFSFTLSGFRDLFKVLAAVSKKDWAEKIRKDLPVFLVSGAEDPVGSYGEGVKQVQNMLNEAGVSKNELKLYDGMRHEILNEDGRETVYADILEFCNK